MNVPLTSPNSTSQNFNLEHFRIRLTARLCCILVCVVQFIPRLPTILADHTLSTKAEILLIISLPWPLLMTIVIGIEYFLFKRLGPGIIKYSNLVDIMLLLFFIGDWVTVVIAYSNRIQQTSPPSFSLGSLFGFTTFSWRTLFVTLIVQNWKLKILAPVIATLIATGYVIHYATTNIWLIALTAAIQLLNIILIVYCEDKVKWKLMWSNLNQEKWVQVNNFILNSIPENIMILGLAGETRFISDYCKSFIMKCQASLDTKDFFAKIRDLQQQHQYDADFFSPSGTVTQTERLIENIKNLNRFEVLEDLIQNFKSLILNKEIQERQFLIYNGKLKQENHSQSKSLEVKISFIQHFENDYIILMLRDTTQRDLLVTLEGANKYKDQLLASVSHELRAPLNGNINLVETAVNSPNISKIVKESLLVPALRSSKFLLHIINDILDMSQIKEKKLRLAFTSENLEETLKTTAQLVELQAQKKGIQLMLEIDPKIPPKFCTDHLRLSQIVLNLLNNAIKFTREGAVRLTATHIPTEETATPSWIKITVEDSGIGMTRENIRKLFAKYTHIEFEERQIMNPGGVGLGLNIAYNLAQMLGPKGHEGIIVESAPEQGSIFTFILENKKEKISPNDLDKSNQNSEIAEEISPPVTAILLPKINRSVIPNTLARNGRSETEPLLDICSCPKVLIVDDNPFNIMAFETILGSLNIKHDSVYSGSNAIEKLQNRQNKPCGNDCQNYYIIFMDQEMPDLNGADTVYEIKKLQEENLLAQNIKIIGCTAHKSKEEVDKFMEAGIDHCIQKPISKVMIQDLLKEFELEEFLK